MQTVRAGMRARAPVATLRSKQALSPKRVVIQRATYVETATTSSNGNGATSSTAAPAPVAAAYPAPAAGPVPDLLTPPETYNAVVMSGKKIAAYDIPKTFIMGLYAGAYIAFGGFLSTTVVNACPGLAAANPGLAKLLFAVVFPVGLFMNTMHGTELFTGNTMKVPTAIIEGKATISGLAKNWFWSYTGNFVGSLAFVAAVVASGVLTNSTLPLKTATYKASLPWMVAFLRAILANWLVCVAVWNTCAANTLPGKIMGIWPPIAAFVAIGLEHSVANMFLIPMGMALGAEITWGQFLFGNLLPVTLGNIVGGMVFMGFANSFFFGAWGKKKAVAA